MNIFISFSSASRESHAIKFLDFFNTYGLNCWYDYHELYLGDELHKTIIENGIKKCYYCVLIINKAFLNSNWPSVEAKKFFLRYKNDEDVVLFPILLDITKDDLKNSKLNYLLSIKYQFLKTGESIEKIGLQIMNRIFYDIRKRCRFSDLNSLINFYKENASSNNFNIHNVLNTIQLFEETNYRDRIIVLLCLILMFDQNKFSQTIFKISNLIYEHKPISFDLYRITESILLINASESIT